MEDKDIKAVVKTIEIMVKKMEDYKYAENGFEDTKEYNELKSFAHKYRSEKVTMPRAPMPGDWIQTKR